MVTLLTTRYAPRDDRAGLDWQRRSLSVARLLSQERGAYYVWFTKGTASPREKSALLLLLLLPLLVVLSSVLQTLRHGAAAPSVVEGGHRAVRSGDASIREGVDSDNPPSRTRERECPRCMIRSTVAVVCIAASQSHGSTICLRPEELMLEVGFPENMWCPPLRGASFERCRWPRAGRIAKLNNNNHHHDLQPTPSPESPAALSDSTLVRPSAPARGHLHREI